MLERLPFPLRLAVRSLRHRPGFTLLAVLILALGIGANGAVFSVMHAMLLRPLPFADPEQLVDVTLTVPGQHGEPARDDMVWSYPKYETLAASQRSFRAMATYRAGAGTLLTGEDAVRLAMEDVGGEYFSTLGIAPILGRDFSPDETRPPAAPRVVVIGHALWQSRFGGDPAIAGRTIRLGGAPAAIIGVAPPGFRGLSGTAELWLNAASLGAEDLGQRWSHSHNLVARLRPGVAFSQALAEVELLGPQIDAAHPSPFAGAGLWGATARSLASIRTDPAIGRTVVVLAVAVGLVLIIACVNLTNLLLARALGRQRELAVCLAVGARRSHLVQMLLAEGVLLGVSGGVVGILLTWLGVRGLGALWTDMSGAIGTTLDGLTAVGFGGIGIAPAVLAFLVGVSMLTALLVGLLPALRASRPDLAQALHGGAGSATVAGRRFSLRDALVTAQLALAVTLLVGAGLMIRSMDNLLSMDAGVDGDRVASARIAISPDSYQPDSAVGFYAELLGRVRALSGVQSAAVGNCPPLNGGCSGTVIWFRDRPPVPEGQEPSVGVHMVSPDWFQTLGVTMLRGRDFSEADRRGGPKVVVINETAARTFWPDEDPIGKPIAVGQGGFHVGSAEIIGIVSDVRFGTLEEAPLPDVFIPYLQAPRAAAMLYVRTTGRPDAILSSLRAVIRELDPTMPVYDVRTMPDRMALATFRPRYTTWVLGGFAAAALALAAVGIYALLAYEVAQRRKEIGIRMALGAGAGSVVRGILRRGLGLAGAGIVVGVPLAMMLTRFLGALLFGVAPGDPATYLGIVVLLAAVAALATLLPARTATRVNPMEAIRTE
jgi:predicted permease